MATRREVLLHEKQFRRAFRHDGSAKGKAQAFAYFCATFAKIQHADTEMEFILRESQRVTAKNLCEGSNIVVLKARQVGFSTLFANYALWKCLSTESYSVLFLSRNREEAVYLLTIMRRLRRCRPERMRLVVVLRRC